MNAKQFQSEVEQDKAASFWLKKAICTAEGRDVLDAMIDAEALLAYCKLRCVESGIKPGINT